MHTGFTGRRAALGTSHEKERVIAPILEHALGLEVFVPERFNSDQFGTFTREKKRQGSQLDAARAKARAAMAITGADIGIASEGSFGPDPTFPLITTNLEIVVLIDASQGSEVVGQHRSTTCAVNVQRVYTEEEALTVAHAWDFPTHGVIVRLHPALPFLIRKDVRSEKSLKREVRKLLRIPLVSSVYLESDMRAHRNPTRMQNIALATEDLVKRLTTLCPSEACQKPGYGAVSFLTGAPCRDCGAKTESVLGERHSCAHCAYSEDIRYTHVSADPSVCSVCNP